MAIKDDNGNETNIKIFEGNRGKESKSWESTKQMAFDLDKAGVGVCSFLNTAAKPVPIVY
ncbi:MAG: hypothetical protein MJ069_03710 [Salinivirgaceae bacterium]|nr:hypothetical protein [Salinivirgaceae bacterium]